MNSYQQSNRPKTILWLSLSLITLALGAAGSYMFLSAEPQVLPNDQNAVQQQMIFERLEQLGKRLDQLEQQRSFNSATDEPSRSTMSEDALTRITQLADEFSSLSARLDELENAQNNLATGSPDKGSGSTAYFGEMNTSDEARLAQKMKQEQDLAYLENKLATEEEDPGLGPRMDGALDEVLAARGWSEQVNASTKCAGTICRFEVEIPASMDATARFELENSVMIGLGKIMPSGAMIKTINNPDGSQTLVGYLGKTSADLARE